MTTEAQKQHAATVGWAATPMLCANPECSATPSMKDAEPPHEEKSQIWDNEYRCPSCRHGLHLVVPFIGNTHWRLRTLAPIEFPERPIHDHHLTNHNYRHAHSGGNDEHRHGAS